MELPINHHVLVGPKPHGNITREQAIELLEPVIRRIRMMPEFGPAFVVGFALRNPDAHTDPEFFIQVAEMEAAYRIEPYFRPRDTLYKGL